MVRTRYIGSNRAREAGLSATHKQDFIAHVTGGDWFHYASQITVTSGYGDVQTELDAIVASISALSDVVIGPPSAPNSAIAIYDGISGKLIRSALTRLDPNFGDLIFPDGTSFNTITTEQTNSFSPGQPLIIFAQNNLSGQGGELQLGSGVNLSTGIHDSFVNIFAPLLTFDSTIVNPIITQKDSAGATNDLFLISQSTTNVNTPGNLWLQSGVNVLGQAGDVRIYSYPGIVDILSSSLSFNKDYLATIVQPPNDVPIATDMIIMAQGIPLGAVNSSGAPGNLTLMSGTNPNNGTGGGIILNSTGGNIVLNSMGGGIVLNSSSGGINFAGEIVSAIKLSPNIVSPIIFQDTITTPAASGKTLLVQSQGSDSGTGGDLTLAAGVCIDASHSDGNVNIASRFSNINFFGGALVVTESSNVPIVIPEALSVPGVYLYTSGGILYAQGADMIPHPLNFGYTVFQPTAAATSSSINYTLANTGGYVPLTDVSTLDYISWGWAGLIQKNDIIRGNVYFKVNVTSGSIALNVRVYEDLVDVADFTIQVAATALEYVNIPIFWKALSSPGTLSVQVWGSAGVSDHAVIQQMLIGNSTWGDFEFLRP